MRRSRFVATGMMLAALLVALNSLGCGGASTSEDTTAADGARDPGEAAKVEAAKDPQVEEARKRCEHEKKKSEIQPPDMLSALQVKACIFSVNPEVASCCTGPKREVTIKIVVEKDGSVSNAFPIGATADCPEAKCVSEAILKVSFPQFKGQMQQVIKYPFVLGE